MDEFDPMSPAVAADPHRAFARARRSCPVHRHVIDRDRVREASEHPLVGGPTTEFWSVFRHDDATAMLQDIQRFKSFEGPGPERMKPLVPGGMLVYADPPAHAVQRRIALKAFAPRMVDHLAQPVARRAHQLLDAIIDRGEADLLAEFSVPLTAETIRVYFGIEASGLDLIRRMGADTVAVFGGDAESAVRSMASLREAFSYLGGLIAERRAMHRSGAALPDDVLTILLTSPYVDGRTMDDQELLMAAHHLLTGGFETTSVGIANAVMLLCKHPDQRALLERDRSLLPGAVEECLRFEPPIEEAFRTTGEAVEIRGCPVPASAKIRAVLPAANRDPGVFSAPDEFRIDREPREVRRHLTFGVGRHACLGAALARLEMRIALGVLLDRLPGFALDPDRPVRRTTNLHTNGFTEVHVRWDVARARAVRATGAVRV